MKRTTQDNITRLLHCAIYVLLAAGLAIMIAEIFSSCCTRRDISREREYVSWIAFCAHRGYSVNNTEHYVTTEYLDTWCGSDDEQQAFIQAGLSE